MKKSLIALAVMAAAAASAVVPVALAAFVGNVVEDKPATPPALIHRYAEISKTEELSDGTMKVYGYASTEREDSDGETITSAAMKSALPDYMKWGAVREMHDAKKAAGTAIEARIEDDGRTFFGAHVVDSEAVKKVKAGVYKGFSIGGNVTARDEMKKSTITGLRLVEVSLVDRPANPGAVFTCFKAEGATDTPAADAAPVVEQPKEQPVVKAEQSAEQPDEKAAVNELAALLDAGTVKPSDLVKMLKDKAAPVVKADSPHTVLRKGLGSIAELAMVVKSLRWLIRDQIDEAAREGDNSPVPGQLRDAAKALLAILEAMVVEEAAEFGAALDAYGTDNAPGAMFAYAAQAELTKAAKPNDLAKALAPVLKAAEGDDLLVKVTALVDDLAKATDGLAKASAEVERLKALPQPGKILLKALDKGDDVASNAESLAKAAKEKAEFDALSPEDKALHTIRKMYQVRPVAA